MIQRPLPALPQPPNRSWDTRPDTLFSNRHGITGEADRTTGEESRTDDQDPRTRRARLRWDHASELSAGGNPRSWGIAAAGPASHPGGPGGRCAGQADGGHPVLAERGAG